MIFGHLTLRRSRRKLHANWSSGESGQSLVEMALLTPVLLLLLVGIIEVGRFAYYSIEVTNAARAAVQYGAQSLADSRDSAGLQLAASNDAPDISGVRINPTVLCACSETPSAFVACPAIGCSGHAVVFLRVDATATILPLFHYPGFPTTFSPTGHAVMRVTQ
jgi:hypothetical protein